MRGVPGLWLASAKGVGLTGNSGLGDDDDFLSATTSTLDFL